MQRCVLFSFCDIYRNSHSDEICNKYLSKKVWERVAQLPSQSLAQSSCWLFSSAFSSSAAEGELLSHYQAKPLTNLSSLLASQFDLFKTATKVQTKTLGICQHLSSYFCFAFCNFVQRCNNSCTHQGDNKQSLWEGWQCASNNTMAAKRMILLLLPFNHPH